MAWQDPSPESGKSFDLIIVSLLAIIYLVHALGPAYSAPTVRFVIGIVLIIFAPGYALVSLLFPLSGSGEVYGGNAIRHQDNKLLDISGGERVVFSIGLSIILVPLVGILLHYVGLNTRPQLVPVSIAVLTLVMSALATLRRWRSGSDRFSIPFRAVARRMREQIVVRGAHQETIVNVILLAGILFAVAGIGVAVATSGGGEQYSEFYLLTEEPESDELVAGKYPDELRVGERSELYVGIVNHQQEVINYTVIVQLQRVERSNDEAAILERSRVDSFEVTLEHGASRERSHAFEPSFEGYDLRLTYLLYVDQPPENPSTDTAHRSIHLWVDVVSEDQ